MAIRVCPRCGARFRDAASRCPHDNTALEVHPDPLIGKVIGRRYRIVEELGAGGMGTVFRARHVVVGRDVAIKLLSREAGRDPVWRERYLREAQTTNLLKHESIVDITDFGDEGGAIFLVMELLEGETLEQRLARGAMRPLEAVEVALPVAAALARAHALGVVHRDIKPGNIFLANTPQGRRVKVLDFGIARGQTDARLTDTGVLLGTPQYVSPEQSVGQPAGPPSDLYSLGVVLFEMLAGRLPFRGNGAHLLVQHAHTAPPRLADLAPGVPEDLAALVARLLAKDPDARFADAPALIAALESARAPASLAPTLPPAAPSPGPNLRTTARRIGGALDVLTRDAAAVAARLEEARARGGEAEVRALEAERDDLAFQIGALKGRMEAVRAEPARTHAAKR